MLTNDIVSFEQLGPDGINSPHTVYWKLNFGFRYVRLFNLKNVHNTG